MPTYLKALTPALSQREKMYHAARWIRSIVLLVERPATKGISRTSATRSLPTTCRPA